MNGSQASPGELLDAADGLLTGRISETQGLWPRPVAFLIRLALERAVEELLDHEEPTLRAVRAHRAKLLCLPRYADATVAARIAYLWHALSNATHYRAYELAPTAAELRRWHSEVADIIQLMGATGAEPRRPREVSRRLPNAG